MCRGGASRLTGVTDSFGGNGVSIINRNTFLEEVGSQNWPRDPAEHRSGTTATTPDVCCGIRLWEQTLAMILRSVKCYRSAPRLRGGNSVLGSAPADWLVSLGQLDLRTSRLRGESLGLGGEEEPSAAAPHLLASSGPSCFQKRPISVSTRSSERSTETPKHLIQNRQCGERKRAEFGHNCQINFLHSCSEKSSSVYTLAADAAAVTRPPRDVCGFTGGLF
ncbi:hypothetical protein AOLI_G00330280 [Acnodon oligacanthus]